MMTAALLNDPRSVVLPTGFVAATPRSLFPIRIHHQCPVHPTATSATRFVRFQEHLFVRLAPNNGREPYNNLRQPFIRSPLCTPTAYLELSLLPQRTTVVQSEVDSKTGCAQWYHIG